MAGHGQPIRLSTAVGRDGRLADARVAVQFPGQQVEGEEVVLDPGQNEAALDEFIRLGMAAQGLGSGYGRTVTTPPIALHTLDTRA